MGRHASASTPCLRLYLRRSKADEGHQQFSLDVQREGSARFTCEELPRRSLNVAWEERIEYVDDDRAGDDFLGRAALKKMRDEVRPGDVVICRDQSRLGRDALEVTLAIRDLVRDRGARLFVSARRPPCLTAPRARRRLAAGGERWQLRQSGGGAWSAGGRAVSRPGCSRPARA